MLLKKLISEGKEIDPLTEYLILQGESYEEAQKGLEPYVALWEQSAEYIEIYSLCSEEYDHDIWMRSELYKVLEHASPEQIAPFAQRIEEADLRFKKASSPIDSPINHIDNPDKDIHWWLFRWTNRSDD